MTQMTSFHVAFVDSNDQATRALGVIRGVYPSIRWRFVKIPSASTVRGVRRTKSQWKVDLAPASAVELRAMEVCKTADFIWLAQSNSVQGNAEAHRLERILRQGLPGKAGRIRRTYFDDLRAESLAEAFDISRPKPDADGGSAVKSLAAYRLAAEAFARSRKDVEGKIRGMALDPLTLYLAAKADAMESAPADYGLSSVSGNRVALTYSGRLADKGSRKVRLSPLTTTGVLQWARGSIPFEFVPPTLQALFDSGVIRCFENACSLGHSEESATKFRAEALDYAKRMMGSDDLLPAEPKPGFLVPSTLVVQGSVDDDITSQVHTAIVRRWVLNGLCIADVKVSGATITVDVKVDQTKAAAIVDHLIKGGMYCRSVHETAANLALHVVAFGVLPTPPASLHVGLDELAAAADDLCSGASSKPCMASRMNTLKAVAYAAQEGVLSDSLLSHVRAVRDVGGVPLLEGLLAGSAMPLTESSLFAKLMEKV